MTSGTMAQRFPAPSIRPFPDVHVFSETDKATAVYRIPGLDHDDDDSDSEPELFSGKDVFTVDQDIFIVRHLCFQSDLSVDDVAKKFCREFGSAKERDNLETRLKTLDTPAFRPLLALYLRAVSLHRDGSSSPVRPAYQALLQSTRSSCESKLLQLIYDDDKMRSEESEMITIEVTSRNFPKYSRVVHKRHLQRCSKAISDLYLTADSSLEASVSSHQAFTLYGANTTTEKLHLTDGVPFYDHCMVFNHLEQPIFDRFMMFAKDPNLMERLSLMKQQLQETTQIKHELTHQLKGIVESQHQLQVTRLEHLRSAELDRVKRQLESSLEEDIKHLRRMHEALLQHERAKIDAKFDEQLSRLSQHIEEMRDEIDTLQRQCESTGWTTLERDIMQSSLQVERIFGTSDYILRLLILAEDLDADSLRRALVRYLSKTNTFPQFALRRELTSKMIPESTILSILKGTPTKDLREIEAHGKSFMYHELTSREIHTRSVTFARFLASLTNDDLRTVSRVRTGEINLSKGDCIAGPDGTLVDVEVATQMAIVLDFPDILEAEYARRREFSCVKLHTGDLDREVSLSGDDCTVQLEVSHRYCTVFATKERKVGESGRWMFEVTIETFGGDGESLLLGWEVPRGQTTVSSSAEPRSDIPKRVSVTSSTSCVPGLTAATDGRSYGVTWQSDGGLEIGMLHANGQSKSGVACFREGDVIGCTINQDELVPYLRFYLNGVQVLPMLTTTTSASSAAATAHTTGIPCHNPVYCLFPVISMYSSRKKPQTRVRFNFRGNFHFPIAGFEPYGAPL